MRLKARNDIHLARRIWHVCGVLTVFALYWIVPPATAPWLALAVCVLFTASDLSRLYFPKANIFFTRLLGPFMRDSERHRIAGSTYMCMGVLLIVFLFPRPVVLLTLLLFAVADPAASYFGIRYGRDKLIGQKSLQGSLAAFVVCFVLSFAYFMTFNLMLERLFIVCLLCGIIGAFAELVPIGKLDDNFIFPVVSATLLTGLFWIFGGLVTGTA